MYVFDIDSSVANSNQLMNKYGTIVLQYFIFRTLKSSYMGNFWFIANMSHYLKRKSRTWLLIKRQVRRFIQKERLNINVLSTTTMLNVKIQDRPLAHEILWRKNFDWKNDLAITWKLQLNNYHIIDMISYHIIDIIYTFTHIYGWLWVM